MVELWKSGVPGIVIIDDAPHGIATIVDAAVRGVEMLVVVDGAALCLRGRSVDEGDEEDPVDTIVTDRHRKR